MLSDTQVKDVQKVILDIFKAVDAVCEKHGLRYFAIGGTCIGAVRHAGFIPWDDDLDIAMPRPDYEKFMQIANQELPEKYRLLRYDYSEHYIPVFSKVHNVETTVIEEGIEDYPDRYTGVWVDIMPLDGMPRGEKEIRRWSRRLNWWNRLNANRRCEAEKLHVGWKLWAWKLLRPLLMGKPYFSYAQKYDEELQKYDFETTATTSYAWSGEREDLIFPIEDFAEAITMPFEDFHMRVPVGYDDFLTTLFGDYMTLPPVEQREHHMGFVDLEKPYSYYQEAYEKKTDIFKR